jgi:hypothetical protein
LWALHEDASKYVSFIFLFLFLFSSFKSGKFGVLIGFGVISMICWSISLIAFVGFSCFAV